MGLKWCWDYGVRHLVAKLDCSKLIQEIECCKDMNGDGTIELEETVSYFKRDCDLHIQRCRREGNKLADHLSGLVSFCQVPDEFADLVRKER